MPLNRTLRRLALTCAGAALVLVSLPAVPATAKPAPSGDPDVRLVVRTSTRAAGAAVAAAGQREGARTAGRVRKLRAVALEIPRSSAPALTRALLARGDVTRVDLAHRRWFSETPADPRFPDQRTYLDAIEATTAWGRPAHGSSGVRIGIIDSGADVTHPDLAGKIAGTYNAVTRGTDVRDVVGHGTGVASVAAATTNNNEGIAGAGYDSSLLVAKVADRTGRIFTDDLAAGVVWAVDQGATVINLSLGGPTSDPLERDAVAYAQRHGAVVVAAAGNEGTRAKQYPAALPDVLSVGATSPNGATRAPFSSFGSWVSVGAPGRGIVIARPGGGYEKADGTSFASPLVAGEVALLKGYRPDRTSAQLFDAVVDGANVARLGFARGLVNFNTSLDLLPPAGLPSLVAPPPGNTVSGQTTVTATSSAAKVQLTLADLSQLVAVAGGTASASFETYGLAGAQTVTATDCSRIGQCASASASSTTTVANPAPQLTAPADGSDASADTVTASAATSGGAVRFLIDGEHVATDSAAPFRAALSTERLTDGQHTVSAVQCRSDGAVCDFGNATSATVSVARLHPQLAGVSVSRLSPGRDSRHDKTTVRYRVPGSQEVTFRVRNSAGTVVRSERLGQQSAGEHTTVWDGRKNGGARVASGEFSLEISTRGDGRAGLATRTVTVDRVKPKLTDPAREFRTVYPKDDGYRDSVGISGVLSEPVRWVRVVARSAGGSVIRSPRVKKEPAGDLTVDWTGRRGGSVLPAGTYRVRLLAQDLAGNRKAGPTVKVRVSGKSLVRRTGSETVTARDSLDEVFADECSLVFRHTEGPRSGWLGYYSSGTCTSPDAYAVGDHQVRLPKAARYGKVQVRALGGRGDPKFRDSARVTYYDSNQNPSSHSFRLAPKTATYIGPRVRATPLLYRDRVLRWSTMTTGTAWYDVNTYTVRFTYFVLR